jgi:hypothetical protein
MGISVIGTWRNYLGDIPVPWGIYEAFVNDNSVTDTHLWHLAPFARFERIANYADQIVGFNSISFDDKLCHAHGLSITTNFDLTFAALIELYAIELDAFRCLMTVAAEVV